MKAAKGVEGMTSVSDRLRVHDSKETPVKDYTGDTAITNKAKAKLLADDVAPSRKAEAETADGAVQLPGTVDSQT